MDQPHDRELVIRFGRWKLFLLFLPMIPLLAISVYLDPENWKTAPAWVYVCFVGFFATPLVGCWLLPNRYFLHLTREGLLIQDVARSQFIPWHEIARFECEYRFEGIHFFGVRILVYMKTRNWGGTILGYDTAIFCMFEMGADDLLHKLEEWHARYSDSSRELRASAFMTLPTYPNSD